MSKVGINECQEILINYNSTHALDLYGLASLGFYSNGCHTADKQIVDKKNPGCKTLG